LGYSNSCRSTLDRTAIIDKLAYRNSQNKAKLRYMTSFKSIKYLVYFLSIKSRGNVNLQTFVCLCYFVMTFVVCLSLEKIHGDERKTTERASVTYKCN